jgi:hypothetical protein
MRSACASKGKVSRTKEVEDRQVERRGGERRGEKVRQTRRWFSRHQRIDREKKPQGKEANDNIRAKRFGGCADRGWE